MTLSGYFMTKCVFGVFGASAAHVCAADALFLCGSWASC